MDVLDNIVIDFHIPAFIRHHEKLLGFLWGEAERSRFSAQVEWGSLKWRTGASSVGSNNDDTLEREVDNSQQRTIIGLNLPSTEGGLQRNL